MADAKKGNHAKQNENRERTRQLIVEDVFLYITSTKNPLTYTYEVGNSSDDAVKLSLDFARSINFSAVDEDGTEMTAANLSAIISPFSRKIMGSMIQGNIRIASRLAVDCYYELVEVDEEEMNVAAEQHQSKLTEQLNQVDSSLFIDKTFLPCSESLYAVNKSAGEQDGEAEQEPPKKPIVWTRPEDFMKGKYDVFLGGIDPGDICQGSLGDCWFLCCLACLGEFPALVENLFVANSRKLNANGKYEIRMCNYGMWEIITLDDFFPCRPNGGPLYARGHDNELWVLLLEKAYAKLCGSYAALKSGWAYEAMIDLLGAPFTSVRFEDEDTQEMIANGSLWELIKSYDQMGHIQTASTPGEDKLTEGGNRKAKDDATGLVSGHAYALLRVRELSTGEKLVEIRNPWGQGGMEWSGDWSDKSPLWNDKIINEIDARLKDDDGAFWMSFEDFLSNFFSINVCIVGQLIKSSDGKDRKPWIESRERFDYTMIIEDGAKEVCANSFLLTLEEDAETVYVSVHQKDIRHVNTTSYIDFGVVVLKVCPDSASGYVLISSTGDTCDRQNQSEAMKLEAGEYLILPTSTGCKLMDKPGQTHNATIVVHSSAPHTLEKKPYNEHAYDNAIELPIMKFGVAKELVPGKITLYTRKAGFSGISYVVKNTHTKTLKFTMDCSKGKNVVSHRGTLAYTAILEPGQEEVVHHIMPDDTMKGWQAGYSAALEWC